MSRPDPHALPPVEGPPPPNLLARVVAAVLRRLERIGLVLRPFVLIREGIASGPPVVADARFRAGFIDEADIPELVRSGSRDAATCRDRLQQGQLCYGIKDGERIVAKMWCDLSEINFRPMRRALAPNEAYLYAAYTDPDVRGQNLAPLMREQCYAALRARGRDVFWSYSDYYNAPARRFKEKLGAIETAVGLYVSIFGRPVRTVILRRRRVEASG